MDNYIIATSTINNYYDTFGFNMHNIFIWIGTYIIKTFLGMIFLILFNLKSWIIAFAVLGGIMFLVLKSFKFYKIIK